MMTNTEYTKLENCLACNSTDLVVKLDLGVQALANNYLVDPNVDEPCFPLAVNLCRDCFHLQLTHAVNPDIIYKNYLYVSGTSNTAHMHFRWFAEFAQEFTRLNSGAVLDIGCNDGTQLDYFKMLGFNTFGIDPAENLYETSSKNHEIYCDFFDDNLVSRLEAEGKKFDIIVAQNSFAHNPDPHSFLLRLKKLMSPNSLFFVQTSQAEMIQRNEFDTIYHEHISYYNINSMNELCSWAGLSLIDVIKTPIHGMSYIFVIGPREGYPARISNLIACEAEQRLLDESRYDEWAQSVKSLVSELKTVLDQARLDGYKLIGYGAAAKGNTLLNFTKIALDYIIDDNPKKQGYFTPGRHVPIVGIDHLVWHSEQDQIMFIPLAWNFYNEIRDRIRRARNCEFDRFVKYFPTIKIEQ